MATDALVVKDMIRDGMDGFTPAERRLAVRAPIVSRVISRGIASEGRSSAASGGILPRDRVRRDRPAEANSGPGLKPLEPAVATSLRAGGIPFRPSSRGPNRSPLTDRQGRIPPEAPPRQSYYGLSGSSLP